MKHIKTLSILLLAICLFAACENEPFLYQDEARIRMEGPQRWTVGTDSLLFSFVALPQSTTEANIEVSLFIMGRPAPHNRIVNIGAVAENTTAASVQYVLPAQVTLPANTFSTTFPVTLKRTADLQDATVRLQIRILDSDDFKVGAVEYSRLLIKWNDILDRPTNWAMFEEFFGTFSMVKYRFMLSNGVPELTEFMSWGQLMSYRVMLQNLLDEYNAANPGNPLRDENNQLITF
jgi:hypothetical protein